jgi:hypothetical protein
MIRCQWKECNITDQSKVELHHIIPKCYGGKHHDELHKLIMEEIKELTKKVLE